MPCSKASHFLHTYNVELQTQTYNIATLHRSPKKEEKLTKKSSYLDSIAWLSEPFKKDLRHQIWKALLRLGHSVPCLEKHLNHSMNNAYWCFKGSVRRAWPIASSNSLTLNPFLHLCNQPKSRSMGLNHEWRSPDLNSAPHCSFLVPIATNRTAETRLSSYLNIGDAFWCISSKSFWFAHKSTKSSAIWRSSKISSNQLMFSTCHEIDSIKGFPSFFLLLPCSRGVVVSVASWNRVTKQDRQHWQME